MARMTRSEQVAAELRQRVMKTAVDFAIEKDLDFDIDRAAGTMTITVERSEYSYGQDAIVASVTLSKDEDQP